MKSFSAVLIACHLSIVIPNAARADDDVVEEVTVGDGAAAAPAAAGEPDAAVGGGAMLGVGLEVAPAAAGRPAAAVFDMQRWLDHQARHLMLGWNDGRLELDLVAMRANALGPDFDRHHAAVQTTLTKAPQLLIDAAVANGLPREVAEDLFADVGKMLTGQDRRFGGPFGGHDGNSCISLLFFGTHMHRFGLHRVGPGDDDDKVQNNFTRLLLAEEPSGPVLYLALALKSAMQQNILPEQHGTTCSNDSWQLNFDDLTLTASVANQALAYEVSRKRGPRWSFALADADGPDLSIRWEADGADDDSLQLLRLRQTADSFRATLIRDGEIALKLEGATFRDCCLANPDAVRRGLIPLLRSIGLGSVAMPDDDAVKAAVVARLRRAAGLQPAAEEKQQGLTDAELEAAKHRLRQVAAAIETFRLLDDAAYLAALKKTAAGDDAAAIDARLAEIGKR